MLAAMRFAPLTAPEQRVLGCLIEKRFTTPDQYPLSLNALRLACNQSTNRSPVTAYDEATVREAAQRLCRHGLARLASGHSSRAIKYRHLAEEALGVDRAALAVLAVLLLRGTQTPGELKARSERMAPLASLAEVEAVLEGLCERELARRLERRPGQKEDRFEHAMGGEEDTAGAVTATSPRGEAGEPDAVHVEPPQREPAAVEPDVDGGAAHAWSSRDWRAADGASAQGAEDGAERARSAEDLERRVAALERQLAELRSELQSRPAPAAEG